MTFTQVGIEAVRKYWDQRPCNLRHSDKPVGTREYFDEVEARKYFVEPHIVDFADFPRWNGDWVLEIGCGIGTDTVNFARHALVVTAVDVSLTSAKIAAKRLQVYDLEHRATIYHGDAEQLPDVIPSTGFPYGLVYSFGVIHHSPHPERILEHAYAMAATGGTLKIMVYNRRSWKVLWVMARYGWQHQFNVADTVAAHSEAQTGCPITYTYTRKEARQMVEATGFKVTDLHVDHIFPYRIRSYKKGELVRTWYWRLVPPRLFRKLERTFGWHLLVTAVKP